MAGYRVNVNIFVPLTIFTVVSLYVLYQNLPSETHVAFPPSNVTVVLTTSNAESHDSHPIQTVFKFLSIAEAEILSLGLDTCGGRLDRRLVEAYNSSRIDYCNSNSPDGAQIECFPVQGSSFSGWWPNPNAFCVSKRLAPAKTSTLHFLGKCEITQPGAKLRKHMADKKEEFLGTFFTPLPEVSSDRQQMNRTLLLIHRQDLWNPYHAAEDLVTTILALLLAGTAFPHLTQKPIQLVFNDDFEIEKNHYTDIWDRMGAWPPRLLSLDPFEPGTQLTNVIHSIGAGSSLLSAVGVTHDWNCASTLVWASSLYYRNLFSLPPVSSSQNQPINILWLSRVKFAAHYSDTISNWQKDRLTEDEPAIITRFVSGLQDLCANEYSCDFVGEEVDAETWASTPPPEGNRRSIRFISMDPSVYSLATQVHYVGHTTILAGVHGGALGLSLFLPPGHSTAIMELHTTATSFNHHFHNMAMQLGHEYKSIRAVKAVDVEETWNVLKTLVLERLK